MALSRTIERIELALIELEYLSSDTLFDAEVEFSDVESRRVVLYYQAACKALDVCLEVIEQVRTHQKRALVA